MIGPTWSENHQDRQYQFDRGRAAGDRRAVSHSGEISGRPYCRRRYTLLSMLVAFTGMLTAGISGNLMSLGAIDFGLLWMLPSS
ncbi:MAG: hypothetical protein U0361_21870 [Nitrospiraceae bacterium]